MSNVIDRRVVEMQFDNSHFERNVSTTMSTLDKLKQSLNLSGAAKGFEEIGSASKRFSLSGVSTAIDTVQAKFSAMGIVGATALANITNSAVNAGKRMVSALTIDPIKTGFQEYETQIGAVQTILANTKSKGTDIDDVNQALDELNLYADKTIYNFTEMTRNIGTFTAAGVDLDKSVSSIKGIANLAAVSGSTSQQASTAMYQLSQALAAGKVQLMDWNSVVNAGMGGQVFQDALKRTAKNMGTDVDVLIKKYGSFRESLTKGEWLTAEVLTETLTQLSGAYTEADLLAKGYTQEQAAEILDLAQTAEDAATKVKTFTQLWDTLKEAAQSGWSQTWEILVGDFEEAKETLSKVSDVLGEMIGNSANARNELLQGWKDAGGRDDILASVSNAFQGIMNIANPIKEAFQNIFPPLTVEQLLQFTQGLEDLTARFKEFTSAHADDIRSAFEGIFSVLDIGWTFIKDLAGGIGDLIGKFSGLGGNIFETAGSLGEWLSNLRDSVKENDIFGQGVDKVVGFLSNAIDAVRNFGQSLKEAFQSVNLEGFYGFFEGLWNVIQTIGSKIGDVWKDAFSGDTNFMNIVNSGLFAGILAGIQKFAWGLSDLIGDGGVGGMLENITGILDDVRGCFEAYQNQLNAGTLMKIAGAIGILAASLFVIAKIDPEALDQAVGAITVLFAELLASMAIFGKITPGISGVAKGIGAMLAISVSVGILALAMKALGSLEWEEIGKGLLAVGGLMAELMAFLAFAKLDGKMAGTAFGIILLSTAMLIMAKAVEDFGGMDWSEIGKGLVAIGGLLAELALFSKLTGNAGHVVSTGVSMVLLGASLKILASAMKDFGGMDWSEIGKGLAAMGGALLELTLALNFMPQDTLGKSVGLIAIGAAMLILADAFQSFGGMDWSEIGKGLVAMGGALAELAIALNLMNGTLAGSAALLVAALALAMLAPVMTSLGEMTWGEIARGLVTIAGAFAVVGVAGLLLTPLVPTLLSLAGAFALFGVSILAIGAGAMLLGAGLTAIATGIGALGTGIAAGATALAGALSIILVGFAEAIVEIIPKFGEMILGLCDVIAECAPAIAETILIVVSEVLVALAEYTPTIVDALFSFLIGAIDGVAARMPELIAAGVGLVDSFFGGIVDALKGFDSTAIIEGLLGVGIFAGLIAALSAIAGLIPGAMLGVLGMGAVIAELAIVLAAVGALAQIPGLNWLIEEGGALLQNIGNALGGFIGGIVGGFAEGVTASLPQIGTDLSNFMTNLQPFIEGAKQLDTSMMESVKMLAETILLLTATDILDGITSWITGGSSLSDFGTELADLATSLNEFATNLGTFDDSKVTSIECAAKAITAMATAAEAIPNEGGWAGKIFGENSIADFGEKLPALATNLNSFATNLGSFDDSKVTTITSAANAIKSVADVAESIPNEGGWAAKIFGENSIVDFAANLPALATNLNAFATNLGTFDDSTVATVTCAANAISAIANAADSIPNEGGWAAKIFGDNSLSTFGEELAMFGTSLKNFVSNLGTFSDAQVDTVRSAMGAVRAIADLADADLKGAKKHLTDFGEDLESFASNLSTFCTSLPEPDSISAAADSLGEVVAMIDELANTNSSVVSDFANSLKALGTEGIDAFIEAFTNGNVKSRVKNAAADLAKQAEAGVKSRQTAFADACRALAEAGAGGLQGQSTAFYNAGANLAIGFANGISANSFRAVTAAAAMAAAVRTTVEEALRIQSPSKVFYELGEFTGLGFVNALDDYTSKAYNAASGLAITARSGLADTISNLASVIDGDMDIQPTIRPVLDLSDVRSGVSSISGMLNGRSSLGVMANIGAISASMARRNQNGVNDDVVSAINKLRKDLPNMGGTTYSINGITYDDGSNIASAIKTITRHVKIEGRV